MNIKEYAYWAGKIDYAKKCNKINDLHFIAFQILALKSNVKERVNNNGKNKKNSTGNVYRRKFKRNS